jgi:hypothetical protein
MNVRCLLFVLLTLRLVTACSSKEEETIILSPFEIPDADGYKPQILEQEIDLRVKDWRASHARPAADENLSFLVIIEPALFPKSAFCVYGSIQQPTSNQPATGILNIKHETADGFKDQQLRLNPAQVGEVYSWFRESRFLDPKEKNALPPSVIDGVSMWIEVYQGKQLFRFYRNAYDNQNSERFYVRVKAAEIWISFPK